MMARCDAAVVPSTDGKFARAECGASGWTGPNRRWWADADLDAQRHAFRHFDSSPDSEATDK